jgi:hypothetical protein
MIVFQSLLTGVAERAAINRLSAVGMSSPGGEDIGEGELSRRSGHLSARWRFILPKSLCPLCLYLSRFTWWQKSVFISVHLWLFCNPPFKASQGHSRLLKPIQSYSRVFGKKNSLYYSVHPVKTLSTTLFNPSQPNLRFFKTF